MATPITGGTAFDFGEAAQATTAQPPAPVQQPIRTAPTRDTVKLSDGAQVRALRTQGQTVPEIATTLALSAQIVNSYLGVTSAPLSAVVKNSK
jgi:hypothetical protein